MSALETEAHMKFLNVRDEIDARCAAALKTELEMIRGPSLYQRKFRKVGDQQAAKQAQVLLVEHPDERVRQDRHLG
jgi:hypothetical protein